MSALTDELLIKARAINNSGQEILEAIEALESLGEDASGKSSEYKMLNKLVKAATASHSERLDYSGIRMINSSFYSKKDNYRKGFVNVDDCARYFNKIKKDD